MNSADHGQVGFLKSSHSLMSSVATFRNNILTFNVNSDTYLQFPLLAKQAIVCYLFRITLFYYLITVEVVLRSDSLEFMVTNMTNILFINIICTIVI